MSSIWTLIYEFFKTGLFAIGGGLATIPFLTEMAEKYGWFTTDMLSTMIAVSESTPGAMGINMATYVGYITNGILGGLTSTLSLVAPSIIIICMIAKNYQKFKDSKLVKELFAGLKPAVVAFIVAACLNIFITTLLNGDALQANDWLSVLQWKEIILLVIALGVQYKYKKLHPIALIVSCACIGVVFGF